MGERVWFNVANDDTMHGEILGPAHMGMVNYKSYIVLLDEPFTQADGQKVKAMVIFGPMIRSKLDILE